MRTVADSDSATSESDVENSYNSDNEVETDSVSESDSDNVDDTIVVKKVMNTKGIRGLL